MNSNFIKFETSPSDKCLIIFSSVDIPPGKFMFWRVMQPINLSKIYINDIDNSWYVNGVPGFGSGLEDSVEKLCQILIDCRFKELIFVGPSMGGFGAILFATLISHKVANVKIRVLSFGGEFFLYKKLTRSLKFSIKSNQNLHHEFKDVRNLISNSNVQITHVYGAGDINDIYQADLVRNFGNVDLICVKDAPHAVANYIGKKFNLTSFISKYLNEEPYDDDVKATFTGGFGSDFSKNIYLAESLIEDLFYLDAIKHLENCLNDNKESYLVHERMAYCYTKLKKFDDANYHAMTAYELNRFSVASICTLGFLFKEMGKKNEAIEKYREAFCLDKESFHAFCALVDILITENNIKDAKELLLNNFEYFRKNKKFSLLYSELIRKEFFNNDLKEIFNEEKYIHLISVDLLSLNLRDEFSNHENNIFSSIKNSNWINVAAIGFLICQIWPLKIRGWLAVADAFFALKEYKAALQILENAFHMFENIDLLLLRYVKILFSMGLSEEANEFLKKNQYRIKEKSRFDFLLKK